MRFSASWTACLALAGLLSPGGAPAAAQVVAGPVCGSAAEVCLEIRQQADIPPAILKQVFTAPSAGTALVFVHGSMQCVNISDSDLDQRGVADFSAQIVLNNAAPDGSGPGGQRIATRVPPAGVQAYSNPITISALRVVTVARGPNTFRYKMALNRLDPGTGCVIYNAQMAIQFTP